MKVPKSVQWLLAAILVLMLPGCTTSQRCRIVSEAAVTMNFNNGTNDPFERVNRVMFGVNRVGDRIILHPVTRVYHDYVPGLLQGILRNILHNLDAPVVIINNVLQGNWNSVEVAATRLFVNTVVGLGGIADIMGMDRDYEYQSADFGQTLGIWGVPDGPYLVLPLLGPSSLRDAVGLIVDRVISLPSYISFSLSNRLDVVEYYNYSQLSASIIDRRSCHLEDLDEIEFSSVDFYAAIRSLYQQSRKAQIAGMLASRQQTLLEIPDYS
jgi:phospholipid-binding lipoprotein MlaA